MDFPYKPGDVHHFAYPFIRDTYDDYEEDGPVKRKTWKPGANIEVSRYDHEEVWANGEGEMIITVVDCIKPGKFPMRVFYTRKFVNPDGKEFGKGSLRMATLYKFKQLISGYRYEYEIEDLVNPPGAD